VEQILLVTEREITLHSVTTILGQGGHTLMVARSRREALRLACQASPEVTIVDTVPDKLKSEAMCQTLRQRLGAPILVLGDLPASNGAGSSLIDAHLSLPFSPHQLLTEIQRLLHQPRGLTCGEVALDLYSRIVHVGTHPAHGLPPKQFFLLRASMAQPGESEPGRNSCGRSGRLAFSVTLAPSTFTFTGCGRRSNPIRERQFIFIRFAGLATDLSVLKCSIEFRLVSPV